MTRSMLDVAPQISCSTTAPARRATRHGNVSGTPLSVAAVNDPGRSAIDEGTSASNQAPEQLDANPSAPTSHGGNACVELRRLERRRPSWGRRLVQHPTRGRDNVIRGATARHVGQRGCRARRSVRRTIGAGAAARTGVSAPDPRQGFSLSSNDTVSGRRGSPRSSGRAGASGPSVSGRRRTLRSVPG